MASALTVLFLGCWLSGQSGVLGQTSYPKPSISLRPSGRIALGAAATIRCQGQHENMRFLLYKDGDPTALQEVELAGDMAEFPIRSMSRRDAGSYRCRYHSLWDPPVWSEPSNPMVLVLVDPSYPKPSISLCPSRRVTPGGAVTVRCQCECRGGRVLLSKAGHEAAQRRMDAAGDVAEFPIRSVSPKDAGSYSCRYHAQRDPNVWSQPSDPVELEVAEGTDLAGPQKLAPPTTAPQGEGRTDPTAPDPTLPHSTGPGTGAGDRTSLSQAPETAPLTATFPWGNIVHLALGAGVLLGLALILADAAHGWRRDRH